MPTELRGNIINTQGTPLEGAVVTLVGGGAPQVQITNAQGQYRFSNLAPGNYTLLVAKQRHHADPLSNLVITANEDTEKTIAMSATEDTESSQPQDQQVASSGGWAGKLVAAIQKSVTLVQAVALSVIAFIFASYLLKPFEKDGLDLKNLGQDAIARGAITYLVSVGTITIAMVLVLFVILSTGTETERKERFTMGKEVLTTLIGVLGTIIGFYYGTTAKEVKTESVALRVAAVEVAPDKPLAGASVRFKITVVGGEQPYTYALSFDRKDGSGKDAIPAVVNQTSPDGKITQDISIPASVSGDVGFQVLVKDKNGKTYTYNEDWKQKINVQAQQPAQPSKP